MTFCRGSLAVLGFLLLAPPGRAVSPFTVREQLHRPLGPLAEGALMGLAGKAEAQQRALLATHMRRLVEDMHTVVKLTPQEQEALELDATSLVNTAVKAWKECVVADLRPLLPKYGDDAAQATRVGVWTPGQLVPHYPVRRWLLPEQCPQWPQAVEKRLGRDRAAAWQKAHAEQRAKTLAEIDTFVDSWGDTGRRPMDDAVAAYLRLLHSVARVTLEQSDKIAAQARVLVHEHVVAEMEVARDMLGSMPDAPLRAFLDGTKNLNSRFMCPGDAELAAVWRKRAAAVVGEAPLQAWDQHLMQEERRLADQAAALFKPWETRARVEMEEQMLEEVDNFVATLSLDVDQRGKLEALAKKAVDQSLAVAREQWEQLVGQLPANQRQRSVRPALLVRPEDRAHQQAVWRDGLKQFFTAEQLQQAAAGTEARRLRMHQALAKVALAEVDALLGLTAKQRAELEPAVALQMTVTALVRTARPSYWSVSATALLEAARRTPHAKVSAILDETQMRHWGRLDRLVPNARVIVLGGRAVSRPARPATGETDVQTEISLYLHKRALAQRDECLRLMQARVEDAQRVLRLPPEKVESLTTAAKGAVEAELAPWRARMESLAGDRIVGATPQNVRVLLGALDSTRCSLNADGPAAQGVWQEAVTQTLTRAQRDTWDQVLAERRAYRVAALAAVVTAELDRRHRLAPAQCEKIQEILAGVVDRHLTKMDGDRLNGQGWTWYLNSNSVLLPLAGAAKAELQEALAPWQWKNVQDRDMDGASRNWKILQMRAGTDGGGVLIHQPIFVP